MTVFLLMVMPGCVAVTRPQPEPSPQMSPTAPRTEPGGSKRITSEAPGRLRLPDGSLVAVDDAGGFSLPNGAYVSRDPTGSLLLPNGLRCVPDGARGYLCP